MPLEEWALIAPAHAGKYNFLLRQEKQGRTFAREQLKQTKSREKLVSRSFGGRLTRIFRHENELPWKKFRMNFGMFRL
jgi:hypothetical protein